MNDLDRTTDPLAARRDDDPEPDPQELPHDPEMTEPDEANAPDAEETDPEDRSVQR